MELHALYIGGANEFTKEALPAYDASGHHSAFAVLKYSACCCRNGDR